MFESTFAPLSALDLVSLKQIAMKPTLLARKLSRGIGISPASEAVLQCDNGIGNFIGVCVVPGGRYILGITHREICIWDLGPPSSFVSSEIAGVTPRCTLELEEGLVNLGPIEAFPHGTDSIRFAVLTHHPRTGGAFK